MKLKKEEEEKIGITFLLQADNSTQMLYAKLIIDKSAIANITSILKNFTCNNTFVVAPVMTTGKLISNLPHHAVIYEENTYIISNSNPE